ncbi:MAG: 30S ribosome-binding factor RbfA [Candidatus Omnitrophica bacterium]|nr:30S ribosome-binding factor RbfA [Candidatus Omnitrophota bacterium]
MQSTRIARLSQELQQEIARIVHQELKDQRVGFVTITRVELSKDLSQAKVFFSCLGAEAERVQSQEALERSARFIHSLIGKRFRLKVIPAILFRYDESIERSIAMSDTFDRLKAGPRPNDDPTTRQNG